MQFLTPPCSYRDNLSRHIRLNSQIDVATEPIRQNVWISVQHTAVMDDRLYALSIRGSSGGLCQCKPTVGAEGCKQYMVPGCLWL